MQTACLFSHAPSPLWPGLSRQSQGRLAWCPSAWRCSWALTQLLKQVPYGPPGHPSFPFPTLTVSQIKTFSWLSVNSRREGLPCCFWGLGWCGILIRMLVGGGTEFLRCLLGERAWVGAQGLSKRKSSVCPLRPAAASGAVPERLALAPRSQDSRWE